MEQLGVLILAWISVILAGHHSNLIKAGKKIYHGLWAAGYLALAASFAWASGENKGIGFDWLFMLDSLFVRKIFFDLPLNKFRGLSWWYISPELKNVTGFWDAIRKGKVNDWLHYKIFGKKGWIYVIIYSIAIIITTILL